MKKGDLVFVYGTLRTGERAGLDRGCYKESCRKIGDDTVKGGLYHLGGFPGVKLPDAADGLGEDGDVHGEVFVILDDHLPASLDSYEGYPNLYGRQIVTTANGMDVWVYTYNGRVNEDMLIRSGDWLSRHSEAA